MQESARTKQRQAAKGAVGLERSELVPSEPPQCSSVGWTADLVERTGAIHSPRNVIPSLLATMTYASLDDSKRVREGSRFPAKADRGNCFAHARVRRPGYRHG